MKGKTIKLISWNVNGLRAAVKKDFLKSMQVSDADIVAIQETKLQENQRTDEMIDPDNYRSFWSYSSVKKGYSGVAVYTRKEPASVGTGIGIPEYDNEGRILELNFEDFTFFNVYFPNGQMSEERLQYKLDFYRNFFKYTEGLRKKGRDDVMVIAGGIIPEDDIPTLQQIGIKAVFGPGTSTEDIISFIQKEATAK